MVIYDLICINGHQFEGWFANINAFEAQSEEQMISCSICGETEVKRVLAGKHSLKRKPAGSETCKVDLKNARVDPEVFMRALQHYVKASGDDVGDDFVDEAIKIHRGETDLRNIYGTATDDGKEELDSEGIDYFSLLKLPEESNN
ncbi:MAG: DUF1178 family protein [Pseudomonadota bacterium]